MCVAQVLLHRSLLATRDFKSMLLLASRFVGNLPSLDTICRRCACAVSGCPHEHLQGRVYLPLDLRSGIYGEEKETTLAGRYPVPLCRQLARCIRIPNHVVPKSKQLPGQARISSWYQKRLCQVQGGDFQVAKQIKPVPQPCENEWPGATKFALEDGSRHKRRSFLEEHNCRRTSVVQSRSRSGVIEGRCDRVQPAAQKQEGLCTDS